MSEYKQILELIETVDPADTSKLEEIDIRTAFFIEDKPYIEKKNMRHLFDLDMSIIPSYTHSRDVLKTIRPLLWKLSINQTGDVYTVYLTCLVRDKENQFSAWDLPTEELAELHAIIQVLAYERGLS